MTTPPEVDLAAIRAELDRAPLVSPFPHEVATAVVADLWRRAGRAPPDDAAWARWAKRSPRWREQLGMLAHVLTATGLAAAAVACLAGSDRPAEDVMDELVDGIRPLTAEMIRSNAFRQEEFLRRFVACLPGRIAGESPERSARRLDKLDYRKTLAEYRAAEKAREKEAAERRKAILEAQQRAAAARGWRE